MDPTRSFCVAAVTTDFDGWKRNDVYELPDGVQSFTLQEFLDYPEVKKLIVGYIDEFQDTLDAVDVHLMFNPETMSGTKPLWRISTDALKDYYSLAINSIEKKSSSSAQSKTSNSGTDRTSSKPTNAHRSSSNIPTYSGSASSQSRPSSSRNSTHSSAISTSSSNSSKYVFIVIAVLVLLFVGFQLIRVGSCVAGSIHYSNVGEQSYGTYNREKAALEESYKSDNTGFVENATTLASLQNIDVNQAGQLSYWGFYEGEPILWRVLDVKDNKALIITDSVLVDLPYNKEGHYIAWKDTSLRKWLNNDFLSSFDAAQKKQIIESSVANNEFPVGSTTEDQVFILSKEEAEGYLNRSYGDRCEIGEPSSTSFWIRDSSGSNSTYPVIASGSHITSGYRIASEETAKARGVRPAMWVKLA